MWRPFYYIGKFIYALIMPFFPTKVIGKENIQKTGKCIYASNHLSVVDIPVTVVKIGGLRRYIAKSELKGKFFIGPVFTLFGCIFIDRQAPKMSEMREIFNWLGKDEQIYIFPEGTRNKTGNEKKMIELKGGLALFAARSGAPVIPCLFYRKPSLFRKNYLYIGEPIDIISEKGRMPSAEDIKKYTEKYTAEFERLRIILDDIVENKRWKKKNALQPGAKCEKLTEWEKENNYPDNK